MVHHIILAVAVAAVEEVLLLLVQMQLLDHLVEPVMVVQEL